MKMIKGKLRYSIFSSAISLLILLCHALLIVFTPNIWMITVYVMLFLSVVNIPLLLLSFTEIKLLKMRPFLSIFVLLSLLLVSVVYAFFSFQAITRGLQTYTGTCQTRMRSFRSYNRIIGADGRFYETKNFKLLGTLKSLSGATPGELQYTYFCQHPVTVTYLSGFNYITSVEIHDK